VAGKANARLVTYLAHALGLPKSAVTIVSGQSRRDKTVLITGAPPEELARRVQSLSAAAAGEPRGP
jgi:hypothetical protein